MKNLNEQNTKISITQVIHYVISDFSFFFLWLSLERMSGRLIILPKKSYTPWNTANVERVLRDERIAKEKEEKLKDNKSTNPLLARREAEKNDTYSQQHFNLFEKEEKEAANKVVVTKQQSNSIGIMPVMLGGKEATDKKKGKLPFYLQVPEENQNLTYEDEKLKLNMDPMKAFTTNPPLQQKQQPDHKEKEESSQECQMMIIQKANKNDKHHSNDDDDLSSDDNVKKKKKKRKHKDYKKRKRSKRSKHKSRKRKDVIDSMEELRERRAEREKNEQERQSHVVYQQSIKPQIGDLNHRTYQDQYNPQFSRN